MPRRLRCASGGFVYHVLNRSVARAAIFRKPGDYAAFEKVLRQAHDWQPMRLLAYCLLPNHWHVLLWSDRDGDLSELLRWLSVTHTVRWHAHHHSAGSGPLYQGRFKSFPVQADDHLWTVWRNIERNALRAGLVGRAEAWRWGSLWHRQQPRTLVPLAEGPLPLPADWVERVNTPQTTAEVEAVRRSVLRGAPFGEPSWQQQTARRLGLESSLRPLGRPSKARVET